MRLPILNEYEFTKQQYLAIVRYFDGYIFHREEDGRYFIKASKQQYITIQTILI